MGHAPKERETHWVTKAVCARARSLPWSIASVLLLPVWYGAVYKIFRWTSLPSHSRVSLTQAVDGVRLTSDERHRTAARFSVVQRPIADGATTQEPAFFDAGAATTTGLVRSASWFVSPLRRRVLEVDVVGGIGNQLHLIAMLLSVAIDAGGHFSVALPHVESVCCPRPTYWNSIFVHLTPLLVSPEAFGRSVPEECHLRDESDQPRGRSYSSVVERGADHSLIVAGRVRELSSTCKRIRLSGYFHSLSFFLRNLRTFYALFWSEEAVQMGQLELNRLVRGPSFVVTVHFRMTDRSDDQLDEPYYIRAISEAQRRIREQYTLLVFSDDPAKAEARCKALPAGLCDNAVYVPVTVSEVSSFYMMALATVNIIAHSTFSFWAAILGQQHLGDGKRLVVTPGTCFKNYHKMKISPTKTISWDSSDIFTSPEGWVVLPANTSRARCGNK